MSQVNEDPSEVPDLRGAVLIVTVVALIMGGLFVYWSARGLLAYRAGVRAAWTEPWVCALGLGAGFWSLLTARRVARQLRTGIGRSAPLLGQPELLVLSVGIVLGGIWAISIDVPRGALFLPLGVVGVLLWWTRRRREMTGPSDH